MKELFIDISPAGEPWTYHYGEDITRVKIEEQGHFSIALVSLENARILKAARMLYKALSAYYDMMTPSEEADAMARRALEMAEGKPRPTSRSKAEPAEPERGPKVMQIFAEIHEERKRQDAKWGIQNHPVRDDSEAWWLKEQAETYRKICDIKACEKRLMWYDIIMEEMFEAFAEDTPESQRAELVQMVAVGHAIIECIDRRAELERRTGARPELGGDNK